MPFAKPSSASHMQAAPAHPADLAHADPARRREAARALAVKPGAGALLAVRLPLETEPSVRQVLVTALARCADREAVQALVQALRSEDAALRNDAIEALKALPHAVEPLMDALLADVDPDVRIFAVNVLESLPSARVEDWLLRVLQQDAAVNVCAAAIDLLAEVGTAASRDTLVAARARFADEPYVAFAADLALRRLG